MRRTPGLIAVLALVAAVPIAAASGGTGSAPAAKRITAAGVGQVKLGATFKQLRRKGLVGRLRPGCELAPGTRSARLRSPLGGSVDFTPKRPRRARTITITRGAKARGVGIGATIPEIREAFPKAKVDRSTEEVFRITLVKIPKNGGGKIQFAVDVDTKTVTLIGVPGIAFCE